MKSSTLYATSQRDLSLSVITEDGVNTAVSVFGGSGSGARLQLIGYPKDGEPGTFELRDIVTAPYTGTWPLPAASLSDIVGSVVVSIDGDSVTAILTAKYDTLGLPTPDPDFSPAGFLQEAYRLSRVA